MKREPNYNLILLLSAGFIYGCQSSPTVAKQSTTKRIELQRHDMSVPGLECVQARIEFDPGVAFGKHTHPGEEIIYVLEGTLEYEVEGKPPMTLKAGDVLFVPTGTIHSAKNAGKTKAAELGTFIVEKGKPLAAMVE